jgi:hypothetical protein
MVMITDVGMNRTARSFRGEYREVNCRENSASAKVTGPWNFTSWTHTATEHKSEIGTFKIYHYCHFSNSSISAQ